MPKKTKFQSHFDETQHLLSGYKLTARAAAKLAAKLKKDPSNLTARLQLLGHYFKTSHTSKRDSRKQLFIVLWMIEHMPHNPVLGQPWAQVDWECNPTGYARCKQLWLSQLNKHPDNADIANNAAHFLSHDFRLAQKLYQQAIALDPTNPDHSRDLAWFLRRRAKKNSPRMRKALATMQDAERKTKDPAGKANYYDYIAELAFDVEEWSLARRMAAKCVSAATKLPDNWNTGNAIHNGHSILGRLALRDGNTKKATYHLRQASKTPGSPQLDSFGPDLKLANEMLRAGHGQPVVEYLEECKRFWKHRSPMLNKYIAQIQSGKKPRLQS